MFLAYRPARASVALFVGRPDVHMKGKGVGVASRLEGTRGHFFFVGTLLAIGVLGLFSGILAARGLWRPAMAPVPIGLERHEVLVSGLL